MVMDDGSCHDDRINRSYHADHIKPKIIVAATHYMSPSANYGMITVHHLQFAAMPGKILASPVRELLAVAQVEPLDVVAVLRERRQRRVTHCL